jgi:hypothetical protein
VKDLEYSHHYCVIWLHQNRATDFIDIDRNFINIELFCIPNYAVREIYLNDFIEFVTGQVVVGGKEH